MIGDRLSHSIDCHVVVPQPDHGKATCAQIGVLSAVTALLLQLAIREWSGEQYQMLTRPKAE